MKEKILNWIANLCLILIFSGIWIPEYRGRLIITGILIIFLCVMESSSDEKKKAEIKKD